MGFFECCRVCPSTKRHRGCHSTCPDYKEQKKLFEEFKEAKRRESLGSSPNKTDWYNNPIWSNFKNY